MSPEYVRRKHELKAQADKSGRQKQNLNLIKTLGI